MGQDREIMIDDTDANIQYVGEWVASAGVTQSSSGNGPAYLTTLHGTTQNASLSYAFSGSQVNVIGSAYNTSEPTFPSWDCLLDGIKVGGGSSFILQQRQPVCSHGSLTIGQPHTITVNIVGNQNQAFFLDYVRYTPTADVPLNNTVIRVATDDSGLQYGPGWEDGSSKTSAGGVFVSQTGGSVAFNFTGTSLSWWGYTLKDPSLGSAPGTGTYSVDGGLPNNFIIPGLPSPSSPSQLNEEFFDTGTLSYGQHQVDVRYNGNPGNAPLSLNYILLQNETTSSSPALTSSGTQVSASSSPPKQESPPPSQVSTQGSQHISTGIIAGAIIGGMLLLLFALIFGFLYHRRRRRRSLVEDAIVEDAIQPFTGNSNPPMSSSSYYQPETTESFTSDPVLSTGLVVLDPTVMNKQQLGYLQALRAVQVSYPSTSGSLQPSSSSSSSAARRSDYVRGNTSPWETDTPPVYYQ